MSFAVFCNVNAARRPEQQRERWMGWRECVNALRLAVWALLMPVLVFGGILFGVFTATEAAAIGCIYALFVAVALRRNFGLSDLWQAAYETARTSAMILMIIAAAAMFGYAVTLIRLPMDLLETVVALDIGPLTFVLALMVFIFVLGMFLETLSIILITTPIALPVMLQLGIDPIWYGILLMINLELALITPPVGMNLFVIKGIADAPLREVILGSAPYVALLISGLILVLAFPPLATWLPKSAGFG